MIFAKKPDKLILATNNAGKVREIKEILSGLFENIVSLKGEGLKIDVVEDGNTFEANAIKKARETAQLTHCWALADDSGLCVDALRGAPGVYSARFAGEGATDEDNNQKLFSLLEGVPMAKRGAYYACVMALSSPEGNTVTAEGRVDGFIALSPKGEGGFGYDPYFYLPEYGKTMAELPAEVKNGISHRYHALRALLEKLQK